jgi:hypothetical protein
VLVMLLSHLSVWCARGALPAPVLINISDERLSKTSLGSASASAHFWSAACADLTVATMKAVCPPMDRSANGSSAKRGSASYK